jgi:hypothetical protein
MEHIIGKFIGPEKIEGCDFNALALIYTITTMGNDNQSRRRKYTGKALDVLVTDEPKDWNYVQEKKFEGLISEFTKMCIEAGITGGEMEPLLRAVGRNFSNLMDQAVYVSWNGSKEDYVPDGNPIFDFLLAEAANIVK